MPIEELHGALHEGVLAVELGRESHGLGVSVGGGFRKLSG
jgi:hypothetical protein